MQVQNIVDISNISKEYHQLVFEFIDFLKSKSVNENSCNYDKRILTNAINQARDNKIYSNIENSVNWQREIRDDR